jgi:mannose-6-phosphate isomerase-like protein (cupin superfamily)
VSILKELPYKELYMSDQKIIAALVIAVIFSAIVTPHGVFAQAPSYAELDSRPYTAGVDADPDMFIKSWKESTPQKFHGSLVAREIFTALEGEDPFRPTRRGAVLTNIKTFCYATLSPRQKTAITLKDTQEIYYVDEGSAAITSKGVTKELYRGVGVLMPPDVEFTLENTGDADFSMYVIGENLPDGFRPNRAMKVVDEADVELSGTTGHWAHIFRYLFKEEDGLATLVGMGPCQFAPMSMGQPHSHVAEVEEIWFAVEGDINILLGKQLRKLPPGTAYKIPPNGETPHSNINVGDETISLFWFMHIPTNEVMIRDGSPIRRPE